MLYQNLNTEIIVTLVIWFIVMFLFAVTLIAGLGSILSAHRKKIASKLKAGFNSNLVVARFTKFFPKR
jgi:hypothetical protein